LVVDDFDPAGTARPAARAAAACDFLNKPSRSAFSLLLSVCCAIDGFVGFCGCFALFPPMLDWCGVVLGFIVLFIYSRSR